MILDPQHIQMAKQAYLPDILMQLGITIKTSGCAWVSIEHDSLKFFQYQGIWLYKWYAQDGESGDAIRFLQRYLNMSFHQALATLLHTNTTCIVKSEYKPPQSQQPHETWQSPSWQYRSEKLIRFAQHCLFSSDNDRLEYLNNERGLKVQTIKKYQLGWLPAKNTLPSKLLIPCYNLQGQLFRLRFRLDNSVQKSERYRVSAASNAKRPFPIGIRSSLPVIIIESELDALLIAQHVNIGVLALGTTATQLTPKMIHYLNTKIPAILISLDNDSSGYEKTKQLLRELKNAITWPVPPKYGKDPGEAWKKMDLKQWIARGLHQPHFLSSF